ncbi:hypothetical protein [Gymnodinialimonas hymeniacidonis]|uniref:hypothetical protein n=1 Tax=Gymnodinialimonas hymeniacidonis TaxID=3126508 RepID=UPI0034C652D0
MSTPCLSLHRVAYDPEASAFRAEVQYLDASGIRRRVVQVRAPLTAGFQRITRGLRDAALAAA